MMLSIFSCVCFQLYFHEESFQSICPFLNWVVCFHFVLVLRVLCVLWRGVFNQIFRKYFLPISGLSFLHFNIFSHRQIVFLLFCLFIFLKPNKRHIFLSQVMILVLYLTTTNPRSCRTFPVCDCRSHIVFFLNKGLQCIFFGFWQNVYGLSCTSFF